MCPTGFTTNAISNDQFVPTTFPGCVMWFRADSCLKTGTSILYDQSGSGLTFTVASAAATLNSIDNKYNRNATLSFASGSSQGYQNPTAGPFLTLTQPFTIIMVGNTDGSATNQVFYDFVTNSAKLENNTSATSVTINAGSSLSATIASGLWANPLVVAGVFSNANGAIYINNSQVAAASGSPGTDAPSGNKMSIGVSNAAAAFLNGKIAEIIVYNNQPNNKQMQDIFAYLGMRYGIAVS